MLQSPSREVRELGQDLHFCLRELGQVKKDILSPIYTIPRRGPLGSGETMKSFHLVGIFLFKNSSFQSRSGSSKSICVSFPGQTSVIQRQILLRKSSRDPTPKCGKSIPLG